MYSTPCWTEEVLSDADALAEIGANGQAQCRLACTTSEPHVHVVKYLTEAFPPQSFEIKH